MMKCGRCGKELRNDDKFCPNCGTPLPVKAEPSGSDHPCGGRYETQAERFGYR